MLMMGGRAALRCSASALERLLTHEHDAQAQECESLARVVRELTKSRAKLVGGRSVLAERVAALQHEYLRVVRIADLSRAASKDNMEKASRAGRLAKQVRHPGLRAAPGSGFPVNKAAQPLCACGGLASLCARKLCP